MSKGFKTTAAKVGKNAVYVAGIYFISSICLDVVKGVVSSFASKKNRKNSEVTTKSEEDEVSESKSCKN